MNIRTFLCRCFAFLTDLGLISLLMQVIVFFLQSLFIILSPFEKLLLFSLLLAAYSLLSAFHNGKSVGREWMGLTPEKAHYPPYRWFIRDFFLLWGLWYLFPLWLLNLLHLHHIGTFFLLIFYVTLSLFCYLLCGYTFADWFSGKMRLIRKPRVESRPKKTYTLIRATLIDLSIIFGISLVLNRLLLPFIFIETLVWLWIIALMYFNLVYLVFRVSVGEALMGLRLNNASGENASFTSLIKRELLFKLGLGYILPALLLYILGWDDVYFISLWILLVNLFVWIFYVPFKGEHWADTLAKTHKKRIYAVSKKRVFLYLGVLGFWGASVLYLMYWNSFGITPNEIQPYNKSAYPFQYVEYPANASLEPYSRFLAEKGQDPKDYIIELFKEKDIVVLCENWYTEDTQWEFIYDLVSDPRFIKQVGNIFTEYGFVRDQPKVDSFLHTTYANDTLLEKATATLMQFNGGNFYYFLKKLNLLNQSLPDSLKIKEHFTDIFAYKYLFNAYKDPIYGNKGNPFIPIRDSLMAQTVIDWHTTSKKKCLVVSNYAKAFMLNPNTDPNTLNKVERRILNKQAQFIQNAFPDKVANVLLYRSTLKRNFWQPIHNGKWRTALRQNQFTPVGFNLKESPFGRDILDLLPAGGRKTKLKYQDLFTGFIFYKPEETYTFSRPRYGKYAAEQELEYAIKQNLVYKEMAENQVKMYTDFYTDDNTRNFWFFNQFYYYISLLLYALIALLAFILTW